MLITLHKISECNLKVPIFAKEGESEYMNDRLFPRPLRVIGLGEADDVSMFAFGRQENRDKTNQI